MAAIYYILDWFFLIFHSVLVVFNLFGWIWKPIRKANLITLTLTGLSWFVLGIFYGIGYCPLTDWHFNVLRNLGYYDLPNSYIKYLIDRIFNCDINTKLVDIGTATSFFLALGISIYLNLKKSLSKHLL